jgi:SMP-30/Gluconolactonase/LRE-like region
MPAPWRRTVPVLVATLSILCGPVPAAGRAAEHPRPFGDTRVFAHVPEPGRPEGIEVSRGVVYVGTHVGAKGNAGQGPSKIFLYRLDDREAVGAIVVEGQNLNATHGVLAMTSGPDGRLYVVDRNPPRLIAIDLRTEPPTQKTYATIPELDSCSSTPCPPSGSDEPPVPDGVTFDPTGKAYVTDVQTGTIFRVAPGGGPGEIWFQDSRIDGVLGPNGITVDPTKTHLFFAVSSSTSATAPGSVVSLPLVERPVAEDLKTFHEYPEPGAIPDGLVFGKTGRLYVTLGGASQVSVLDPDGAEIARFPSPVDNVRRDVPYDNPANLTFNTHGSLLVVNQAFFSENPEHWVVFDVWVGDLGV